MNAVKLATPLMLAIALVGCNKKTDETAAKTDSAPVTASTPAAPANNVTTQPTTVTAQSGTATATATVGDSSTATAPNMANMTAEQHQEAREEMMKSWSKANKAMNAMVKDPSSFDIQVIRTHAAKMAQDNPWAHFPESAKGGEAKDAVWTDATGFQQQIDRYKTAVSALNTAAQSATNVDGVKTQIGDVGASCKSCHEKYKED